MRIVAGELGGRQFDSPKSAKTHPMSDKARGALFNVLGDITGLDVLDAFAGTGACSFEAISRGANSAIAIEQDRLAQRTIAQNIQSLELEHRVTLIATSVQAWLQTSPHTTFDLVLCDPPYTDVQPALISRLAERVTPDGILVLSWPDGTELPDLPLLFLQRKSYGDATLAFYRQAA